MAQSILYNLAGNLVTKLGSFVCRELGLLWGVNDELDKLKQTLSAIQAVLLDAEEQQSNNHAVKDWVSKLKDVLYEIDDLIDESSYETLTRQVMAKDRRKTETKQVCMFFSKFKSNLKMGHKIKEVRQRLKAINDDKTQFSFSNHVIALRHDDELKKKRETYSFILEEEVIGRNVDKEEIIKLLLSSNTKEDIAIISIVGMGGLGKTTLTQYVYNNNMITKYFELKLWVCVSEEFDVKIIVEKIIESATKKKPESFLQIDSSQTELRRHIDGKKYLLVMDDVWNEDHEKWVNLKRLLMGGSRGSRILITTHGEPVAKTFDSSFLYSLQNLDECNSWLLFKKMTFLEEQEEEHENSNLVDIGKEIVAKLKGVPLAIRTIGRLLYENKSKKNYWSSFKDKELHQVMGQEKNDLEYMRSILELSYKYLSANLKQCFLYCALFPKDYEIPKDDLILKWKAQGYIPPNDKDDLLIDIGEDYFLELLSRSFFQEAKKDELGNIKVCKMHDLMHDLACSIMKNECVHGLENDIDKRTRHISLEQKPLKEMKELSKSLSKARNLRTFFVLNFMGCWKLDHDKLFQDNLRLRALSLMFFDMDRKAKFFESIIGKFKHLRYLSIFHLNGKDIPNCITELYNLETLILEHWTKLEKLPSDIKKLINLKHLNLWGNMNLEFLPNSITELCKLETLILGKCQKLNGLPRDVKNWINLRHLDLSYNRSIEYLSDSITQLNNLETLLFGSSNLKELPKDIKKLINLKHLDLKFCYTLNHMPKGLGELTNLQTLTQFVLGDRNSGGELSDFNGLNKLKGSLCIRNLQFCNSVDLQMKAKLLQLKSGLEELELKWNNISYNEPRVGDLDERVLDCLQPHSNLREIGIEGYRGVKLCNWLSSYSLGRLVAISLVGCERLQHLPQFDQFPNLKDLSLQNLPSIEYIGNNDFISSSTCFPSLEKLRIKCMPKLKGWWKLGTTNSTEYTEGSFSIIFPFLSNLQISSCPLHILMSWHAPALTSLQIGGYLGEERYCIEEDEFDVIPWENFKNLSFLMLCKLSKLEYLPNLQHLTTLQHLSLRECENLKRLPEWIDNLTSLTNLGIIDCKKLALLPEGIRHIHALQTLIIYGCPMLEERCKKDIGEDWPKIDHIPKLYLP